MESYETIGGLFKEVKQEYEEFKLNERILSIILQILSVLELFVDSIDLVGITSKIISNCEEFSFLRQNKEGLKLAY